MDVSMDHSTAAALQPDPQAHDLDLVRSPPRYNFAFGDLLKREYRFGLDPSRPYCKAFREGHCPLGHTCPDKHQLSHSSNNLVCKHWLRGLCKKGDLCEFLHEYNLYVLPFSFASFCFGYSCLRETSLVGRLLTSQLDGVCQSAPILHDLFTVPTEMSVSTSISTRAPSYRLALIMTKASVL